MLKDKCILKNRLSLVLFVGVLLSCLLALVPNSVSAFDVYSVPNNNGTELFDSYHSLFGGCFFQSYDGYYYGSLLNDIDNCGYRYVNNHLSAVSSDSDKKVGESHFGFNRDRITSDGSAVRKGGYNILNTWDSSVINEYGQHAYNTLNNIRLTFQSCPPSGQSGNCVDGLNLRSNIDGYAIFIYAFKPVDGMSGSAGTVPRIESVGSGFNLYDNSGNYINTDDFNYSEYADSISSSLVWGGFTSSYLENLIPTDLSFMNLGDDYQYLIGSIPTFSDKYLKTTTLHFYPARGISYDWDLGGHRLGLDGYFNFLTYQMGGSYKNIGTTLDQFSFSDARFAISICSDSTECDYYSNFDSLYKSIHESSLSSPNPSTGSSNLFMSWFNVFNISFIFPFKSLFTSFSDNNCVNIPIIAGMVNSSSSTYCSWWSSDIRSVLTPVFNMISLMVLTGFIVHWLSEKSTTINIGGS